MGLFRADKGFDITEVEESDDEETENSQTDEENHGLTSSDDEIAVPEEEKKLTISFKEETSQENKEIKVSIQPDEPSKVVVSVVSEPQVPLDRNRRMSVRFFYSKVKKATLDVWWLYDDGGEP